MFSLFKLVLGGTIALALLVPVGIVLAVVGLPLMLVAGLLAVPVALALAVVGLPLLLLVVACVVVLALVGTAVGIAIGLAAAVVKVALFVVLPIALVVWLARKFMARHDAAPQYDWA